MQPLQWAYVIRIEIRMKCIRIVDVRVSNDRCGRHRNIMQFFDLCNDNNDAALAPAIACIRAECTWTQRCDGYVCVSTVCMCLRSTIWFSFLSPCIWHGGYIISINVANSRESHMREKMIQLLPMGDRAHRMRALVYLRLAQETVNLNLVFAIVSSPFTSPILNAMASRRQ